MLVSSAKKTRKSTLLILISKARKNSRMRKDRPASFYPIYGAIVILTVLSLEKQQSLSISTCRDKKETGCCFLNFSVHILNVNFLKNH